MKCTIWWVLIKTYILRNRSPYPDSFKCFGCKKQNQLKQRTDSYNWKSRRCGASKPNSFSVVLLVLSCGSCMYPPFLWLASSLSQCWDRTSGLMAHSDIQGKKGNPSTQDPWHNSRGLPWLDCLGHMLAHEPMRLCLDEWVTQAY